MHYLVAFPALDAGAQNQIRARRLQIMCTVWDNGMPTKTAPKKKAPAKKAAAKKATTKSKAASKTATAAKKKAPAKSKAKSTAKSRAKKAAAPAPARSAAAGFQHFEPYKPKRGEEYMSDAQLEHFKDILLQWKSALMQEVDRTVMHMKDEAANFPDPADRATQEEEFSLELRTRDRERKLIKKIDSTIERIEQDDYGFCDACGVEIGIKRLEARPTATLCIDCKTLAEIKERQELG
jgi:DnaK suppressor protein